MLVKVAKFNGTSDSGEKLVQAFLPGDSIEKLAGAMHPQIQAWLSNYKPAENELAVLVNAMGASEYYGSNSNGDIFYEEALSHDYAHFMGNGGIYPTDDFTRKQIRPYGFRTFLQALPFVHHKNKDPNRAFGKVALSIWNDQMKRVELVVLIDKVRAGEMGAQHVVDGIERGDPLEVSMGCRVAYDTCTICGHKSKTRKDYCKHIKDRVNYGMNRVLPDGRKVSVINPYPRFFDISFVLVGADKIARVIMKLASSEDAPSSVLDAEELYGDSIPQICDADCMMNKNASDLEKEAAWTAPKVVGVYGAALGGGLGATIAGIKADKDKRLKAALAGGVGGALLGGGAGYGLGTLANRAASSKYTKKLDKLHKGLKSAKDTHADVYLSGKDSIDKLKGQLARAGNSDTALKLKKMIASHEGTIADSGSKLNQVADRYVSYQSSMPLNLELSTMGAGLGGAGVTGSLAGLGIGELMHDPAKDHEKLSSGLGAMFADAKKIKVGPPPEPNRSEYPFVGSIKFRGLAIHVENIPGSYRTGKGWSTEMKLPYGEIDGTLGADKDKVDVYVGPYTGAKDVYVVHQNFVAGPNRGTYDEDKVMVGFSNPDQAKAAYLAHYDNPKFFRSMTTMTFEVFKAILKKNEVHGEKIAGVLNKRFGTAEVVPSVDSMPDSEKSLLNYLKDVPSKPMQKTAEVDPSLTALFDGRKYETRDRKWVEKSTGKTTHVKGSGFESMDKAKTASFSGENYPQDEEFSAEDLVKMSYYNKEAALRKWAELTKRVGPGRAVGKVVQQLSAAEPNFSHDEIQDMSDTGLRSSLSTLSSMGSVMKPEDFQRLMVTSLGMPDIAEALFRQRAVFTPNNRSFAPCGPLGLGHAHRGLMQRLSPGMGERSYFGPQVQKRIMIIVMSPPARERAHELIDSPLLTKVASAYNWYRSEQIKTAMDATQNMSEIPELTGLVHGVSDGDFFKEAGLNSAKNTGVALMAAVPAALMYSSHLRDSRRKGHDIGGLKDLVADHPWAAALATGAGVKKLMSTPQGQAFIEELLGVGKRIVTGKATG